MSIQPSDQEISQAIEQYASLRSKGLMTNLLAFGRVLKTLGFTVSLSQVMDASRSLEFVDIARREDFHAGLRANLLNEGDQIPLFHRVFDDFWQGLALSEEAQEKGELEVPSLSSVQFGEDAEFPQEETVQVSGQEDDQAQDGEPTLLPTYSPREVLTEKDFSELGIEESRAVRKAIMLIASKIATQVSRRKKRAAKGNEVDPRWTMKKSLKYGGEPIELVKRKRRIKKTRVILLCDVSGSMDCYSRFLIQFMYGLQNELWGVETFVFSTSLTRITHLIRTKDIANALERISHDVLGWSGGTNIGRSLDTFNRDFAPSLVTSRTVVVIISDGWDRGSVTLLEDEIKKLKRRCKSIIWLNPLLASEDYQPLCKGMQAVLPYLDYFLSVHNVQSLVKLGSTMQKLVA